MGRCLYKALGSDQEIGSSRNHPSTFLYFKILQYNYALLSLHTLLLYESLRSKNLETIVISLDGPPEHRTIVIVLSSNPPISLSEEIVSLDGSLKTSKPVPYYLKR